MVQDQETGRSGQGRGQKWAWMLLGLVLFFYVWLIASCTVDLPYADDYGTLIDYVSNAKEKGFAWSQLWSQQSEHRPVFGRLITLTAYHLVGRMNFMVLTLVGNLAWACCVFIMARHAYRRAKNNAWVALTVVLLMLVPVHHENALWGISGLAFYGLSAFCLASFALMAEKRTAGGLVASVWAVMTSAGGFLVFPVISGDLLLHRQWKRLLVVLLTGSVLTGIFFVDHHAIGAAGESRPIRSIGTLVSYVFCFLGGAFPSKMLALLAGSLLVPALIFLMWRSREDRFLAMVAAFLLLTATAAAWSRSRMGVEQALDSRYSVFSLIALTCVLTAATTTGFWAQGIRPVVVGSLGAALAVWLTVGVFQTNRWNLQRIKMLTDFYLVINRTKWNGHLTPYLDRARRLGVYDAWTAAAAVGRLQPDPYVAPRSGGVAVRGYTDVFEGAYLLGWAHLTGRNVARAQIHIIAESDAGSWRLPVWRYDRPDLDPVFNDGGSYLKSGFQIAVADFALPAGSYRLHILVEDHGVYGRVEVERSYEVSTPPIQASSPN